MEWARIFSRKKFLILIVALLLINVLIYVKQQDGTVLYNSVSIRDISRLRTGLIHEYAFMTMEDAYETNTERVDEISVMSRLSMYHASKEQNETEYHELYSLSDEALRREYPELVKKYDSDPGLYTEEYFYIHMNVLSGIQKRQEYIMGFPQYMEKIEEQVKSTDKISIFKQDASFSKKNSDKTLQDYQRIKDIPLEVGNDEVLDSVVKYDIIPYLILIFILFLLLGFSDERKTGLWNVVYSTKNGRKQLALRRCGILLPSVAGIHLMMYISLFLTSLIMYGDRADLFRNVQSIEMFSGFTIPMTVLEFLFWYIGFKIIASLAVAFFIWLVFSVIDHLNVGIALLGLTFSFEWLIYHFLPVQSNLNIVKYVNLFCFINVSQDMIGYRNIRFFTLAVSRTTLILLSSILLSFVLFLLCIIANEKKRPFQSWRLAGKIFAGLRSRIAILFHKTAESLGIAGMEIYKVLFAHKGILVLIALCYFLFSGMNSTAMYYSSSDYIVNSFYEEYNGLPADESLKYIEALKAEIAMTEKNYADAYDKYRRGELSSSDLEGFKHALLANENKAKALSKIESNRQYLQTLEKNKNIKGWFINPRAYDYLIGEKGYPDQIKYALYAVFCMILLLSNVFSYEYKSNTKNLLRSTVHGRNVLFHKKIACASIITFVVWLLAYGSEIFNIHQTYGITCLGAPVQSLPIMAGCSLPCSIGVFLCLLYGIRLLLLLSVSFMVCYLSVRVSQSICLVLSSVLFLMPALLSIFGIALFKYLSIVQAITVLRNLFNADSLAEGIIPGAIMIASGLACLCLARNRWCRTQ